MARNRLLLLAGGPLLLFLLLAGLWWDWYHLKTGFLWGEITTTTWVGCPGRAASHIEDLARELRPNLDLYYGDRSGN